MKNKLSYALGISIGNSLKDLGIDLNIESLSKGITHIMNGEETEMTADEANSFIQLEL